MLCPLESRCQSPSGRVETGTVHVDQTQIHILSVLLLGVHVDQTQIHILSVLLLGVTVEKVTVFEPASLVEKLILVAKAQSSLQTVGSVLKTL